MGLNAAASPARPIIGSTGIRARIASIWSLLGRLPLGVIMTIQLFVYPQAWREHLVWGSILVFLLTRGPGAISFDRIIGIERPESSR